MGPSAFGQPAKTMNKGKGTNCQLLCALIEANEKEKEDENMWHMETQRLAEREANNGATTENTNKRILKAANPHSDAPNDNQKCTVQEQKGNDKHVNSLGNKNKQPWEYTPVVDPCNITAKEIQSCSGFEDLESLLTYIMVANMQRQY
jgi:hypothetical protein